MHFDRSLQHQHIDSQVDQMMKTVCWRKSARLKREQGGCHRGRHHAGLGYKEILDYLNGPAPLRRAVYMLSATRGTLPNAT